MEFRFNINEVFKSPIVEITQNLIPPGYTGDRRALWDTVSKVGEIVNQMGVASAKAQGLSKPITSADRMRNSEHKLYFLIDKDSNNGKGAVTGMLKTGNKSLYVFDRDGNHYQVQPPCLLDFYIHETKQRNGLGKVLFEHMLQKESIEPVQMAIDRPSDKLLGFLNKHYSLQDPVKQMNNYVVFDDFFPRRSLPPPPPQPQMPVEGVRSKNLHNPNSANGLQSHSAPMGRYGAPRPPCSMGQIIHNQSPNDPRQEATGVQSMPATNYQGYHQQPYSPDNTAYVTQSTPNMYYDNQQSPTNQNNFNPYQMQANYQNMPGQNWQQQDINTPPQSYGTTGQMVQGTTSTYPPQNQNIQSMGYFNQNTGQYSNADQTYPMEHITTYLESYQPRSNLQSDKIANAAYNGGTQLPHSNQYQQSTDPNTSQLQADNAQEQDANEAVAAMANTQQITDMTAQQQLTAQQQVAMMAAQQLAANIAAQQAPQQEAASMAAQQQTANMTAQQQAVNMAAQQQSANMAAQQQAANMTAQQQAANMAAAQQQVANIAAQQQANMTAQQQAANMAAQQQAAYLAAQQQVQQQLAQDPQQVTPLSVQEQAAQYQDANLLAKQQAENVAAQQMANIMAYQQAANMASQQYAQMAPQIAPLHPQYETLMPSVTSQSPYQPVQGIQSAPLHPSAPMGQYTAVSQSVPTFAPNPVPIPNFVPQNFSPAAGDQTRRVMSAGVVPLYTTPVPSKQEVAPNLQYQTPNRIFQVPNPSDKTQSIANPNISVNQFAAQSQSQMSKTNERGDRPFSAELCGADRFRVIDAVHKKNDGTDYNIKKAEVNDFKHGYPPQVSLSRVMTRPIPIRSQYS